MFFSPTSRSLLRSRSLSGFTLARFARALDEKYTSSVSGQDEPNLALWLATRAGKMELSILPARDTGFGFGKFMMFWCFIPYNKSFIDQACSVKMARYWPRSFLRVYGRKQV